MDRADINLIILQCLFDRVLVAKDAMWGPEEFSMKIGTKGWKGFICLSNTNEKED